jgi:hypothetical protein
MKDSFIILLIILSFISCEKGEIAIKPHETGDAIVNSVDMYSDYRNQIYFDLETNEVVGFNQKIEWDLAFECGGNGNHIFINTAKSMFIAKSNAVFSKIDTIGLNWTWEASSGNLDSTAFEGWTTTDLFFIDLGYNSSGSHQGFGKLQIIELTANSWIFNYCNLNETAPNQITLQKNDLYNASFFSFLNGGKQVQIEPPKEDWDICFTQYTHIFQDLNNIPYLVSGAILNKYIVEGSENFTTDFIDVNFESTITHPTNTIKDIIGYDWKYFDFDIGKYAIDPSQNFIIKSTEGIYFKLHFTDFYNETGEKGYPKFEFQEL